jgi:hypothetical protein
MMNDYLGKRERDDARANIRKCQAVLGEYLLPNSRISDKQAIERLADILNAPETRGVVGVELSKTRGPWKD